MQTSSRRHNYSSFIWPFNFGNWWKEGKKIQKTEYLENEKSFLGNEKVFFIIFEMLSSSKM